MQNTASTAAKIVSKQIFLGGADETQAEINLQVLLSFPKISQSYVPFSVSQSSQECVVPRSEKMGQTAPPGSQQAST